VYFLKKSETGVPYLSTSRIYPVQGIQEIPEPGWIENQYVGQKERSQGQEEDDEIQEKDPQGNQNTVRHAHGKLHAIGACGT